MKKTETRDRFRIICETKDAQQLGPIVAELARLGLNNVHYELITDVLRYKKNSGGVKAEAKTKKKKIARKAKPNKFENGTGTEAVVRFAKKRRGNFNTKQLKELFAAEGRNVNSVFPTCDVLLKHKLIKRIGAKGSGEYRLLAKASKQTPPSYTPLNGAAATTETLNG